ncbi:uncharacterized protein BDW47DRAFT_108582 [Aspergillus candidus]|uniref:Uncharacterized protein n=1 Tax=Aspergillus candidus TaxID=41067 RepID=A0A2I2F742_ASPCN|nr:hypothetical protein BDW47DRAFT_108582 [Aspergillus candidus]PLB36434.1 hypothetical protein BDW47DRAFT_108582 [Aspergillus candidus]
MIIGKRGRNHTVVCTPLLKHGAAVQILFQLLLYLASSHRSLIGPGVALTCAEYSHDKSTTLANLSPNVLERSSQASCKAQPTPCTKLGRIHQ